MVIEDLWGSAPYHACQGPYNPDPTEAQQPIIDVSTTARKAGWLSFCTVVLQEWGYMTGLYQSKKPSNVMYPVISSRNLQRKACGHAPH